MSWLGISLVAAVLTVTNLITGTRAWRDLHHNGDDTIMFLARQTASWANVRRDLVRLLSITGCIVIIIPALGRDGDTTLSPFVLAAMLIPVGIAINSFLDRRDRLRIEALLG